MKGRFDLYEWRNMIASPQGPPMAGTRHVLLTLSLHMNTRDLSAFPSQVLLAERAGLSERSVRDHLEKATKLGWLDRRTAGNGQSWRHYRYDAKLPEPVLRTLPEKPWQSTCEPSGEAPANPAAPSCSVGKTVEGAADFAEAPANNDESTGNFQQKVRQDLPLNSSINPSLKGSITQPTTLATVDNPLLSGSEKENRDAQWNAVQNALHANE